jgi:hypothetical protein
MDHPRRESVAAIQDVQRLPRPIEESNGGSEVMDARKNPKEHVMWGYYNFGRLLGIQRTRKGAVFKVESHTGNPWKVAKKYMEVHKVRIAAIDAARKEGV